MKKIYFIVFLFLSSFTLLAQEDITISGPDEVEVGIPTYYSFSFNPVYEGPAVDYRINVWKVYVNWNLNSVEIPGNINGESQSTYIDLNTTGDLAISIQWGDAGPDMDEIRVVAQGDYLNSNGHPVGQSFTTGAYANTKDVEIKRVCPPNISQTTTINCSTDTFQISALDACSANTFNWSLSEGTIVSGQGTATITVAPPLRGDFSASVTAGRSSGNPNYTRTSSETITRTERSVEFESNSDSQIYNPDYICKGNGMEFIIQDDDEIVSVSWNAPNSTISPEVISNGKRKVTITPNSSYQNGSSISISAVVSYIGGCTSVTQTQSLVVYEPETPPAPQGYIYMVPIGGDVCDAQGYEVIFVSSNPAYANGRTTISPTILPPHAGTRPRPVTVCNINFCSGQQTCTTFMASPPAPCNLKILEEELVVYPNPTAGSTAVSLGTITTGSYTIFNFNGLEVQNGHFENKDIFNLEFSRNLKPGNYLLQIETEGGKITRQIILK